MKNIRKIFTANGALAMVFAALALASCKTESGDPQFGVIENNEVLRSGTHKFELDYRFEYITWSADDHAMREIQAAQMLDFFGPDYVHIDPMESAEAFDQATMDTYTKDSSGGRDIDAGYSGYLKIRSFADVVYGRVVTYTIERAEYTGGAHGMETVQYSNYDLLTGTRLTLDDLFTPEGKAALGDVIRTEIMKEHGVDSWDQLMDANCYYAADEVAPTENFRLSEGHITFMYDPYDIACYAQGPSRVKLALNDLAGFKKESIGE